MLAALVRPRLFSRRASDRIHARSTLHRQTPRTSGRWGSPAETAEVTRARLFRASANPTCKRPAPPPISSNSEVRGWPPRLRGCSSAATVGPLHPQPRRRHNARSTRYHRLLYWRRAATATTASTAYMNPATTTGPDRRSPTRLGRRQERPQAGTRNSRHNPMTSAPEYCRSHCPVRRESPMSGHSWIRPHGCFPFRQQNLGDSVHVEKVAVGGDSSPSRERSAAS